MKLIRQKWIIYGILSFVFILFITACYEEIEGCRDIRAINYNVSADIACENECCIYPGLYLAVTHKFDTLQIDTNSLIPIRDNQLMRIKTMKFYLSGFMFLEGSQYDSAMIDETIQIGQLVDSTIVYKYLHYPVAKVKIAKSADYKLGSLSKADSYQQIEFKFGLIPEVNNGSTDKIATSNPLYLNQDSMYISKEAGYYFLKFAFEINGENQRMILLSGNDKLRSFRFNKIFDFTERSDRYIGIVIDYKKWFENIDFETMGPEEIEVLLMQNLSNSFRIE